VLSPVGWHGRFAKFASLMAGREMKPRVRSAEDSIRSAARRAPASRHRARQPSLLERGEMVLRRHVHDLRFPTQRRADLLGDLAVRIGRPDQVDHRALRRRVSQRLRRQGADVLGGDLREGVVG
jgi:hypothetical protein